MRRQLSANQEPGSRQTLNYQRLDLGLPASRTVTEVFLFKGPGSGILCSTDSRSRPVSDGFVEGATVDDKKLYVELVASYRVMC